VEKPEDVSVEVVPVPGGVVLRYSVAPSDVGKFIGAQDRNARSLRVIAAAIGMGAKLRISLDIPGWFANRAGRQVRRELSEELRVSRNDWLYNVRPALTLSKSVLRLLICAMLSSNSPSIL
jgi:predicted RNA-binding protein YlqC (UPF0109 family)